MGENLGEVYKTCSACSRTWITRDRFLSDPDVVVIGYQAYFKELELGLFLFNHTVCGTTLGIKAGNFVDLSSGPVFRERLTGTDQCPGYCIHECELSPCPQECECAYIRDVMNIVNHWRKD
jgi:hypothetical protein